MPSAKTIEAQAALNVSGPNLLFQYPTNGINSVRLQIAGAGSANEVSILGSVDGLTWIPVGSVTGNNAVVFSTLAYDFVKAETTIYDAIPFNASWKLETFPSAFGIIDQSGDQVEITAGRMHVESSLVDENGNPYTDANPVPIDGAISVTVGGIAAPQIINTPAPALSEYMISIPSATKTFNIKMRNSMGMRIAWVSGDTSSNYITMQPGTVYGRENLLLSASLLIYVFPKIAGSVIELEYWV